MSGEKFIETPSLVIKKNIMTWDNTMIQLSNVSYLSASSLTLKPFPFLAALIILGGLCMLGEMLVPGLLVIACGAAWIYSWCNDNETRQTGATLTIRMNSGHNLYFSFANKEFLLKVLDVLENIIINGGANSPVSINIAGCTISNSSVLSDINT